MNPMKKKGSATVTNVKQCLFYMPGKFIFLNRRRVLKFTIIGYK